MRLKKNMLTALGVKEDRAQKYLPGLNQSLAKEHIDTPLRVAHFLAQVLHESGGMRFVEENLNYSEDALRRVFKKYFTAKQAKEYARKPKRIGSRVYGNRMGNGDEASGEGYLYRGRGLIQLTGKNNYRAFSKWLGDDMVAAPDQVSQKYPVQSAVYFWAKHNLNALADLDDVRALTKAINGGFNGLAHRMELLDKAKRVLSVDEVAPAPLEDPTHEVTATQLNLRSLPRVAANTWIGTLPQGSRVKKLANAKVAGWWRVRATLNGRPAEGFVSSEHLKAKRAPAEPAVAAPSPAEAKTIRPVHLREKRTDITRARDGGRAYPLGEASMPKRKGSTAEAKTKSLVEIIGFLDSEKAKHLRYQPKGGTTYCNIYAYDYCYLAGAYLPRVWWTERALRAIHGGKKVDAKYGETVRELNANMLHDWFEDYGQVYGWQRLLDLDTLQAAANGGGVCIIVGQRTELNSPGHIVAVVPEGDRFQAKRNTAGEVTHPLQSQAGRNNARRSTDPGIWWKGSRYRSFGLWHHA